MSPTRIAAACTGLALLTLAPATAHAQRRLETDRVTLVRRSYSLQPTHRESLLRAARDTVADREERRQTMIAGAVIGGLIGCFVAAQRAHSTDFIGATSYGRALYCVPGGVMGAAAGALLGYALTRVVP